MSPPLTTDKLTKPIWSAYQFLFVFIAGVIGDIVVHIFAHRESIGKIGFGKSLMPYYDSFRSIGPGGKRWATTKTVVYGGILGGVATVVALIIANIIQEIVAPKE